MELVEFKLREGSKLDGLRLNDFRSRYSEGILICAVEREGSVTIPNGDFVLAAGDYVTVVGAPHELHELFRKIGEFRHEAESVIIVGGGRIAERLALELARMRIHSTIIERDPARCRVMKTLLPEATIICADGTKPDVLREEGLSSADALVTVTESDETNLIISSFAYNENVPKIVTKVDEDNFIQLAESYGLTTIIQPADVTAGRIVEYVRWMENSAHSSGVETLRMVADGQAEALEFIVRAESQFLDVPLKALKDSVLVASIIRRGKCRVPSGNDAIELGDRVVVVTTNHGMHELKDILK